MASESERPAPLDGIDPKPDYFSPERRVDTFLVLWIALWLVITLVFGTSLIARWLS